MEPPIIWTIVISSTKYTLLGPKCYFPSLLIHFEPVSEERTNWLAPTCPLFIGANVHHALYHTKDTVCLYMIVLLISHRLVDLVSSVNLTISSFKLLRQYGLSVPGAYRRIISYPQSLTWKLTNNTTTTTVLPSDMLLLTEQDNAIISHKGLSSTKGVSTTTSTTGATDIEMCFILESSCYATSMLRELLSEK